MAGLFDDLVPQQSGSDQSALQFHDLVPSYTGSVLPISQDQQGKMSFDPNAGLLGRLQTAITAPYDVYTGKQPIFGANGQFDPQMLQRATDTASFFSPGSAAMRAGEMLPGQLRSTLGAPSAQQLKNAGAAGYNSAFGAGLDIASEPISNMAKDLQQSLQGDKGIIAKTAPKTYGILDELANPPQGSFATLPGLDAARRGLSAVSLEGGTEGLAARHAIGGIDSFMSSLSGDSLAPSNTSAASPEAVSQTLTDARANYAAAQRSNDLTGTLDKANTGILEGAEARAEASHSGRNIDNAIRQRVASFIQSPSNLAGFSQPEVDALKAVVAGGPVQNTARYVSNMLGGRGGMHGALMPSIGALIGGHFGGEPGIAAGAAIPAAIGMGLKSLENSLARRSLNNVDELVRQRSPLYQQMQQQGLLNYPSAGASNAVWRTILPGLLAPQQPAQPITPAQLGLLARGGA